MFSERWFEMNKMNEKNKIKHTRKAGLVLNYHLIASKYHIQETCLLAKKGIGSPQSNFNAATPSGKVSERKL